MEINHFSRIDRAVADNIIDIERSFGPQAGLVQDFIVFITRKLKTDLFGFTRFTVQEFCHHTGRRRQELALIHPDFASGKVVAPELQGYSFNTVLDYALYSMMERNIIFSRRYEVKEKDLAIQMHNFPILKDLRLNFNRKNKELKVYDVRLSDEMLEGFLSRYYTLNTEAYRTVGKGRGGDGRKKLLLYLSKIQHVLSSTGQNQTVLPMDRLCHFAEIRDIKASHKKQNLIRVMNNIQSTGHFPFNFVFSRDLYVQLFFEPASRRLFSLEHSFYYRLLNGLRSAFASSALTKGIIDEDKFQYWLVSGMDVEIKAQVLCQAYYAGLHLQITTPYAIGLIKSGEFLKPLQHHIVR